MAKKRDRKGGRQKSKGDAPTDGRGLRRHLRRLEKLLAEAAKKEGRRVRKLEKAHIRRQRIETEMEAVRMSATMAPDVEDRAGKAAPASSTGAPAPGAERAKKTPAGAARKAARSKASPAKSAQPSRQRRWKPTSPRRPPARYRQPSPSLGRHATCPRLAAGRAADPDRSLKLALRDGPPMLP